jgi:transcription elongation factor Elf1
MTDDSSNQGKPVNDGYRCELCGAAKVSPDSIAETEAEHFVKCPRCGQWFDPEKTE